MAQPTFETLLYSVDEGVATITLNRPDRMNAFTPRMMLDLIEVFDVTDADDAVKAVIVTGAGERAFCAGADLGSGGSTFDASNRPEALGAAGPGGVLARDGDGELVAAVGVSGDTSDNDETVASAGIRAAGLVADGG